MIRNEETVHSSLFSSLLIAENFKTARLNSIGLIMTHGRGLLHLLHAKLVGETYARRNMMGLRRSFGDL